MKLLAVVLMLSSCGETEPERIARMSQREVCYGVFPKTYFCVRQVSYDYYLHGAEVRYGDR